MKQNIEDKIKLLQENCDKQGLKIDVSGVYTALNYTFVNYKTYKKEEYSDLIFEQIDEIIESKKRYGLRELKPN